MKKVFTFLILFSLVGIAFAQSKLKDDLSIGIIFEGGVNFENKTKMPVQPHHINFLENGLRMGAYMRFGARLAYKEKLYLQFSPRFSGRNRNVKTFENSFTQQFPDHFVYLRTPPRFVNLMGIQFALGYTMNFKHLAIAPFISAGFVGLTNDSYYYILREPGNNQIEEFSVRTDANAEVPLSIGFEANHPKLPILQLVGELSYSNIYKSYTVTSYDQTDFANNQVEFAYEVKRPRLAFSLGIRIIGRPEKANQP